MHGSLVLLSSGGLQLSSGGTSSVVAMADLSCTSPRTSSCSCSCSCSCCCCCSCSCSWSLLQQKYKNTTTHTQKLKSVFWVYWKCTRLKYLFLCPNLRSWKSESIQWQSGKTARPFSIYPSIHVLLHLFLFSWCNLYLHFDLFSITTKRQTHFHSDYWFPNLRLLLVNLSTNYATLRILKGISYLAALWQALNWQTYKIIVKAEAFRLVKSDS